MSVGHVFVTGEGPSPQAARHHAAQQALEELRKEKTYFSQTQLDGKFLLKKIFLVFVNEVVLNFTEAAVITEADTDSNLKSPVSLTHELALKLNQTVEFTVVRFVPSN